MANSTYGSPSELASDFSTIISGYKLKAILASLGSQDSYYVTSTDGDQNVTADNPYKPGTPVDLLLVNDKEDVSDALVEEFATVNAAGVPENGIGQYATYVTNSFDTPVTVYATGSAFVELQGTATVDGGSAFAFVADASNDAAAVKLAASDEAYSKSWLIGGSGSDTLTGSSSSLGSAVLNAGSGDTTMNGGAGAVTMYGGGHTTMYSGDHSGQMLYDYTAGSQDSLVAGPGGGDLFAVASGNNVIDDTRGNTAPGATAATADTLYAGSGMDTLYGSQNGSVIALGSGSSSVLSAGSDTVYAAGGGSDTITAGTDSGDVTTIGFAGKTADQISALVSSQNATDAKNVTITFSNSDGSTETATLNNFRDSSGAMHIKFINN